MKTPLTQCVMATLLLAARGSREGSQEADRTVTPAKVFPDASLTIFPLTVFWTGEWEKDEAHRAFAGAYQQEFRQDKARPFAYTLGLLPIMNLPNSHQEDFQRISPKNLEDCDRLVLERFKTELH